MKSKRYIEGYKTGRYWSANWMPGGPLKFDAHPYDKPEVKANTAQSQQDFIDWHEGFNRGLTKRLQDENFRQWWETNRDGPHIRYKEQK